MLMEGDRITREYVAKGMLPRVEYTKIIEHIDHAVKVAGIDHVGLGSDFDGANMPYGMEDASMLPQHGRIVLVLVPCIVVPIILFGRREKRLSRTAQDRIADVGAYQSWWSWLRIFDGQGLTAGDEWRCEVQPPLPYPVRFRVLIDQVAAPLKTLSERSMNVEM